MNSTLASENKDMLRKQAVFTKIATITGIQENTLRRNFRQVLEKKRAERKAWLRKVQNKRAITDTSPIMAIFLGRRY